MKNPDKKQTNNRGESKHVPFPYIIGLEHLSTIVKCSHLLFLFLLPLNPPCSLHRFADGSKFVLEDSTVWGEGWVVRIHHH